MGTAWDYNGDQKQEYLAVRNKAGLMDVSGLKKIHLVGPHAAHLIDEATTRNVEKITPGKSTYACMLNDAGKFIDDCIIYRISTNSWMVVHGSGAGHQQLQAQAQGKNVAMLFDDDLHDLSLQGPASVDFLDKHVPGIRDVNYFRHIQTTLFGAPVMISRTGYTGERGYEIFCRAADAGLIWDTILAEGKSMGIIPSRFTTLDWLRVESYLLFYPYDNSDMYPFENEGPGDTLWELGLDFTVSPGKDNFRGASEHYRLKGKERFKIYGLKVEGNQPAGEGDTVLHNGKKVGITTCGMVNPESGQSMAIARLSLDTAVEGTKLSIEGTINTNASAHPLPFYDIDKKRRTAKG
jgi:aminomethyltransferase